MRTSHSDLIGKVPYYLNWKTYVQRTLHGLPNILYIHIASSNLPYISNRTPVILLVFGMVTLHESFQRTINNHFIPEEHKIYLQIATGT